MDSSLVPTYLPFFPLANVWARTKWWFKLLLLQLNDAYEEVDEQRQVVAQWKRKTQKVNGELNDTKLLLEEQTSRNVLLEKKQRKFDAEIGLLQEDRKQESNQREKLQREVDALKAQKYGLDEQIHVSTVLCRYLLEMRRRGYISPGFSHTNLGWTVLRQMISNFIFQIFGTLLMWFTAALCSNGE